MGEVYFLAPKFKTQAVVANSGTRTAGAVVPGRGGNQGRGVATAVEEFMAGTPEVRVDSSGGISKMGSLPLHTTPSMARPPPEGAATPGVTTAAGNFKGRREALSMVRQGHNAMLLDKGGWCSVGAVVVEAWVEDATCDIHEGRSLLLGVFFF